MKKSKKELQGIWDTCLIENWIAIHKVGSVIYDFFNKSGVAKDTDKDLLTVFKQLGLKRTPRQKRHLHLPTRAFVYSSLPNLHRYIYDQDVDGVLSVEKTLAWIQKHPKEDTVSKKGKTSKGKSKAMLNDTVNDHRGHRRSDWEKVKPTSTKYTR